MPLLVTVQQVERISDTRKQNNPLVQRLVDQGSS